MNYYGPEPEKIECIDDCCNCQYLFQFDICSPENSFYYLDLYESYHAARRVDEAANMKEGDMIMSSFDEFFDAVDISTRQKRRRAISNIIKMISRIHNAEFEYMERIPENLQGGDAYSAAEESLDMLNDAIDALSDAY